MKYDDVENIWAIDLTTLSNADRGRVFFERAKQVISRAFASSEEREVATEGTRFRRSYLTDEIGCQPAVTTQNPRVRQLLADADARLRREHDQRRSHERRIPGAEAVEVRELKATVDKLQCRIAIQDAEIADLRRKLREVGWIETELVDHGSLPW